MPSPIPDVLRATARRFLNEYRGRLRQFEERRENAPGMVVSRTGGHTPGHSVVRLASGGERLDVITPLHSRQHSTVFVLTNLQLPFVYYHARQVPTVGQEAEDATLVLPTSV